MTDGFVKAYGLEFEMAEDQMQTSSLDKLLVQVNMGMHM